ncbi:TRAP transporter substrate-binding protein [Parabacteroides sp. OttesenSCG-928-N08]|nr:TRAP transporter substrate-binding protein [Parabacteroides sp. OttesenSCG-928-N08]
MRKQRWLLLLVIPFLIVLTSCKQGDKTVKTLKLAHGLPPTHSVHLGLIYMNEKMKELSDGKLQMEIYSSGQLGSEMQCIELLQIGSLDMTKVSSSSLESFADPFKVFGIPYMFRTREHYFRVIDGPVGEEILASTERYWFRGLVYFDSGARSFYTTNRAIRAPKDLSGLKIRVQRSPIAVEMMRTFGGSATPVDWGELYTALQSNVVDGAENNTPSITTAFHHEVAKYFSVNEHTMCPDVIIISMATWDKLDDTERRWIQQAAEEAVVYQRQLWDKQEKESLEQMKQRGVEVIYPDKKPFMEAAAPMIERYKKMPAFQSLINQIEQTP